MADSVAIKNFDALFECLSKHDKRGEFFEMAIPEDILIRGVERQNEPIVKLLLEKKVYNVNYQDDKGNTALHYAAKLDSNEILNLLLENSANVEILNNKEMTALQVAVLNGRVQNYETLAKVTSDQDRKCKSKNTLHLAIIGQSEEIVAKLIDDENVYWMDKWDRVPLYYAAARDSSKIVKLLIERMENNSEKVNLAVFITAGFNACKHGQYENYLLLLDYLQACPKHILFHAILGVNERIFEHVLNKNLYYYKNELNHHTIYRRVIKKGNYAMCVALIDAGFDILSLIHI